MLTPALIQIVNLTLVNAISLIKRLREAFPNADLLTDQDMINLATSAWEEVEAKGKALQDS